MINIKRIYAPAEASDGTRILVDRLWPRGIARDDAKLDDWMKEISPSDGLRTWFGHQPDRWDKFARCYRAELQLPHRAEFLDALMLLSLTETVTLLYGARNECQNNAIVIQELLRERSEYPATNACAQWRLSFVAPMIGI